MKEPRDRLRQPRTVVKAKAEREPRGTMPVQSHQTGAVIKKTPMNAGTALPTLFVKRALFQGIKRQPPPSSPFCLIELLRSDNSLS